MYASIVSSIALASSLALISFGGGLYEFLVIDPIWPRRPDIIQPDRGGGIAKEFLDTCSHGVRTGPYRDSRDGVVTSRESLLAAGRADQPRCDARLVPCRLCSEGSCH